MQIDVSNGPATSFHQVCASKWALEALSEGLACEMKTFGVRVALVEPGIIDTAMARRIGENEPSLYPHRARIATLFAKNETWQLRHPVGPDALPLIAWRKSMSDEDWIDLHSADDETFRRLMDAGTGA